MIPTLIPDHEQEAVDRLIQQYKDKPNVVGFIRAMTRQTQEMEQVIIDMFLNRSINDSVGQQLDELGTIVGIERQGFDDDFYRILIRFKIGQNISRGEPERIISTMKLISEAGLVHYQNLGSGNIGLGVDVDLDPTLIDFIFDNMQRVVMAGIRIDFITSFCPDDESFSFDGVGPVGMGFSSLAAPATGGKFAFLNNPTGKKFAFDSIAGIDTTDLGFGTILDPLAGGVFVGL